MGAMAGLDSMGRYYRHDQRAGVARGNFFHSPVLPKTQTSEGSIYDAQRMTRDIVVYWYSFSNPRTMCIHYGFSLVGNNLNNTLRTP